MAFFFSFPPVAVRSTPVGGSSLHMHLPSKTVTTTVTSRVLKPAVSHKTVQGLENGK